MAGNHAACATPTRAWAANTDAWAAETSGRRASTVAGTPAGGLFVAGTIQASNELCLVTAQTRNGYYSCMDAARDRLVSSGVLTTLQAGKMMTCAKRVQSHQIFPIF